MIPLGRLAALLILLALAYLYRRRASYVPARDDFRYSPTYRERSFDELVGGPA